MGKRVRLAMVVAAVIWAALLAWRYERIPDLPPRPQADVGTVKQDLLVFARAERAYYASTGRYLPMRELRTEGLLSLPPETRWPYSYFVVMPSPKKFVVVAMGQGAIGGRPLAMAIDEKMDMRRLDSSDFPAPRTHRRQRMLRTT